MDPFSIVVGSAGLADLSIKFAGFLKQAKHGFQQVDEDLEELSREITSLSSLCELIKRIFEAEQAGTTDPNDKRIATNHWQVTQTTLASCRDIIEKLEALVVGILRGGKPNHVKLNSLRKYLKQQSKDSEFIDLRRKLNSHQVALQTSLAAVNIIYTRDSRNNSKESFSDLSQTIQKLGADLQSKIVSLQDNIESSAEKTVSTAETKSDPRLTLKLKNALASAQSVVPLASLNRYFDVPQTVSSIFTGRATDLETLRESFHASPTTTEHLGQKRFVVHGLPGSGKTQFCCKFASDNKQRFWGIFWIDASSRERAKQSFSLIALNGKIEPNERAAKNWLSSLGKEAPWLLIIDNADEASFPVEDCFPDGESGCILITTRNPMLKVHGTVAPRHFRFDELSETESVDLLLKAAGEPLPWSQLTLKSAEDICRTLGYLPLALLHAGKTISGPLCTLDNYLSFFDENWDRIRKLKNSNGARSVSDENAAIYSSYELIHDGIVAKGTQASEDALDLLKIFSFLHRQRIRVDIFLRAASNPLQEILEQEQREQEDKNINPQVKQTVTWRKSLKDMGIAIYMYLLKLGDRPVLPRMLRDALESRSFDKLRLREALKELFQMSLIFANPDPKDESYSMHAAVHLWVRERPEMTISDQAVWCHATATILTQAILLPPLGDNEENEILRRDLLPHVSQVQQNERVIRARFLEILESRKRFWPILQPRFDRRQAMQLVKFSLVYTQCDHLEQAEKLQLHVVDFALKRLGMEHNATMDIMLLLSSTYWRLTRGEEAAELQKRVLEACIRVRGKDDLKTLKIMDAYGSSLWQQGRVSEARKLHESAVAGLKKVLGDAHIDTLRAMGNLGRAVGKDFYFTAAIKIHSRVVDGLCSSKLGSGHLDTLIARDNLAMAYFDRAAFGYGRPGDLDRALSMEQKVFDLRKEKLGREHLFTLWAGLNLARIRAVRGDIDEALAVFLPGHEIAIRNLGETHFAVLFAKLHYGRILLHAHRYEESEIVLSEVVEAHEGPRKGHPDRLLAIFSLIKCRNLLGKQAETVDLLKELTERTIALFGTDHAWVKYLLDPQNLSKEPDNELSTPTDVKAVVPEVITSTLKMMPVAMIAKYGHI